MFYARCAVTLLMLLTAAYGGDDLSGSIRWFAARAKANGETSVELSTPKEFVAVPGDLASAARHSSVVVADLVEQCTTVETYELITWTKYHIRERLGLYNKIERSRVTPMPDCMTPPLESEFITAEGWGTAVIDGITVVAPSPHPSDILPTSEPRLLFVIFLDNGNSAALAYSQASQFSIKSDGHVRSMVRSPLADDIERSHKGQTASVRSLLRVVRPETGANR